MKTEYEIKEKVPTTTNSIIYVVGKNYYFMEYGLNIDITWQELIEKAVINNKLRHQGSCLIIIEEPLGGKVYQFGNYDRKYVYEHGNSKGYA